MAGGEKIELFKFIRKTYCNIGLHPPESNQSRSPINSKNCFFLFCLAQFFLSTAAYLVFEVNSATEYGMVFYTCQSLAFYFFLYLILIWQMKNILTYIENCERFIEKRTHSKVVYQDANEKIERLTELSAYAMLASALILVLSFLLYTMVNYYILDAGKESFFLFFPTWWPFDWKTPIGYCVAWLSQCLGTAAATITGLSFFNIVFASSYLFIVIVEDITNDAAAFNDTVGPQKDSSDREELMERFCDIVQHYSDAKQITNNFNDMFKYSLFAFFLWNMLSISSILVTLQFQLWDDDSKPLQISIVSMSVLWVFIVILAICEPGERVTEQFDEFGIEIERCEWYNLWTEMQRMYLIFLSDTQQPKYIQSYGGILCTRDTFKKITNKGFSYFMTLRNFRA